MAVEVEYVDDILALYPDMVVHPVNCTGVCKDAFSKQLKRALPDYFRHYTRSVLRKHLKPGHPEVFEHGALFGTRYLVILPVKNHWKETMLPPVVKESLGRLAEAIRHTAPATVAMPDLEGPPEGWLAEQLRRLCGELPFDVRVSLLRSRVDAV